MRLNELREIVKGLSRERLALLLVEIYRAIPKAVRDKRMLDDLIHNPPKPGQKRPKRAPVPPPDIDELRYETETLLENAYADNYFAPNQVIPYRERPKWRFVVMRLCKDLQRAAVDKETTTIAADLLLRVYDLLNVASGVYLFRTDDPFGAVRIPREKFFQIVLSLQERVLPRDEFIEFTVRKTIQTALDDYSLNSNMLNTALGLFKTPDDRERALTTCFRLRKPPVTQSVPKRGKTVHVMKQWEREAVTDMVFALHLALHDVEAAIADFKANFSNKPGALLYYLLYRLYKRGLKDLILREYDEAVKKGIQPSEDIRCFVQGIRKEGRLPEYFKYWSMNRKRLLHY